MKLRTRIPALLASVLTVTGSITFGLGVTPAMAAPAGTISGSYPLTETITGVGTIANGPGGKIWFGGGGFGTEGSAIPVFGNGTTAGAFSSLYRTADQDLALSTA
ncbi:MAG: hypothetical protein WBD02_11260, partial [Acidimicrobiia bacterium]